MHQLKALQTIAVLCLPPGDVENAVHELSAFSVVAFRPIVTSSMTSGDKIIRIEQAADGAEPQRVDLSWFEIAQHASWNESTVLSALVVNIEPLIRKDVVAVKVSASVDVVFVG